MRRGGDQRRAAAGPTAGYPWRRRWPDHRVQTATVAPSRRDAMVRRAPRPAGAAVAPRTADLPSMAGGSGDGHGRLFSHHMALPFRPNPQPGLATDTR